MASYLDRILAWHRAAAPSGPVPQATMQLALDASRPRGLAGALAGPGLSVIAEVKRRSPMRGPLDMTLDPALLAGQYALGGAAALSVLTDEEFFSGSAGDLVAARAAVSLPVLRKDFTVSELDVYEARAMGADAVLLIVAALSAQELERLSGLSRELGMDSLVEVHDEGELDRALRCGATLVGVNQRDLHSFAVDPERAARMRSAIPEGILAIAESGIASPADARRLADAGYEAVLVGEGLVRSAAASEAVAAMVRAGRRGAGAVSEAGG
ncbi:MAG: indole-3-glycerol phosphate synthase TrpC [Acidimicrobiales bacterium]